MEYSKIKRSYASHKKCFICKDKNDRVKLTLITPEARLQAYFEINIFIFVNSKCCFSHFSCNKYLSKVALLIIEEQKSGKLISNSDLLNLLEAGINLYIAF